MNKTLFPVLALLSLAVGCGPHSKTSADRTGTTPISTDNYAEGWVVSISSDSITLFDREFSADIETNITYDVKPETELANFDALSCVKTNEDVVLLYSEYGNRRLATLIAQTQGYGDTTLPAGSTMPKTGRVTSALALRLGAYRMTRIVDTGRSECGQDYAAKLYAAAKRIETEQALAQRDLELVYDLNTWREALASCRAGAWVLAEYVHGGGTAWGHNAERDCAELEDFLAHLATRLPIAEGSGNVEADKVIDQVIDTVSCFKSDFGNAEQLKSDITQCVRSLVSLKDLIQAVPPIEAKEIAVVATEHYRFYE